MVIRRWSLVVRGAGGVEEGGDVGCCCKRILERFHDLLQNDDQYQYAVMKIGVRGQHTAGSCPIDDARTTRKRKKETRKPG